MKASKVLKKTSSAVEVKGKKLTNVLKSNINIGIVDVTKKTKITPTKVNSTNYRKINTEKIKM